MFRSRELREELQHVQEELSRLQDARERQVKQVETLVRQRDMYYVLLKQNTSDSVPRPQVKGDDETRLLLLLTPCNCPLIFVEV